MRAKSMLYTRSLVPSYLAGWSLASGSWSWLSIRATKDLLGQLLALWETMTPLATHLSRDTAFIGLSAVCSAL